MMLNRTTKEIKEELGSLQTLLLTVWEDVLGALMAKERPHVHLAHDSHIANRYAHIRTLLGGSPAHTIRTLTRVMLFPHKGRPVHPEDNFFEIGGHSILATRLTFQLRQALKMVGRWRSHSAGEGKGERAAFNVARVSDPTFVLNNTAGHAHEPFVRVQHSQQAGCCAERPQLGQQVLL
jgi:hypothetical protein